MECTKNRQLLFCCLKYINCRCGCTGRPTLKCIIIKRNTAIICFNKAVPCIWNGTRMNNEMTNPK